MIRLAPLRKMTPLWRNLSYDSAQSVNISLYPEYTEDTGNVGCAVEDNSMPQCSSDPKQHHAIHCHHSSGDTGHVGKCRAKRAGLSANQITNVIRLQGLACFRKDGKLKKTVCDLKASTKSFYSSFQDWQEKNYIQTEKADKNRT